MLGKNVEWDTTHTLVDILGSIDVDITGTIQDQISQLFNEKVSATQLQNYVASQLSEDVSSWLNINVNPVGSAVVVDSSLTISGAAADAKIVGDNISDLNDLKSAINLVNLISTGTVETGKFVDGRSGGYTANSTCDIVKDINVENDENKKIRITYLSYYYAGFAFYDVNHQYISGSTNYEQFKDFSEIVIVPTNAVYLSITIKTGKYSEYSVISYISSPLLDSDEIKSVENILNNLKPKDIHFTEEASANGELTNNYAWNASGSPIAGANYKYIKYSVSDRVENDVVVTGVSWGFNYPLISCYSEDDELLLRYGTANATNWKSENVTLPDNTDYVIVNGSNLAGAYAVSLIYVRKSNKTQATFNDSVEETLATTIPKLCTLQDAFVNWMAGEKFPIAFYGDSTTDGWRTTDWVANELGTDHYTGHLYTDVLQKHLRECCNNSALRIYNAGFTGQTLAWALNNFEAEFINSGVAYSDVKMIGISFGINDAIGNKTQYDAFKSNLIALIKKCYSYGIQPFLVTTQATYEADLSSRNETIANHTYANQIKKEVADIYNLELIDTEKYTARFIAWSKNKILDIIPDTCHFADIGHNFEGGMYFWQIVPRTIYVNENDTKITPYTVGITSDIHWRDGAYSTLFANAQGSNKYKTLIKYDKGNTADIKVLDFWAYLNRPMVFTPFFGNFSTQYMIIDGTTVTPTKDTEPTNILDMGLHHIVIMSGTNETVYAYGGQFTTE